MFDGEKVIESDQERVLGIIVGRNILDWSGHLSKILQDCARKLAGLKLGAKYFNFKQRLETGRATHISIIMYGLKI